MNIPIKTRRRERGQAMVEFAFIIPVLVLIIMGIVDLGRGVYAFNVVSSVARESARYGAFKPTEALLGCTYPFLTDFCRHAAVNTAALEPTLIVIVSQCLLPDGITPTANCHKPNLLEVTVLYTFRPVTLLFSPLVLQGKSSMMIEIPPSS